MKIKRSLFWGYIDNENKIHIKKYVDDRTIENYERLPFVTGIFDPFYADNITDAANQILDCYRQTLN